MPCAHFTMLVPPKQFEDFIAFLIASLGHTGFKEHYRPVPGVAGLGEAGTPYLWISSLNPTEVEVQTELLKGQHLAFDAENGEQVRKFHDAALKAGAKDNGKPGLRPQYHPNYYAAFVYDPVCGLNLEVVCHKGDV